MIAIIDYGVGNLFSVRSSFARVGADAVVTSDERIIRNADKLLLPGVGAYADAVKKLRETGLDELLITEAQKGKHIMGICLGMQLLFEKSFEYGEHTGLGLLQGEVVPMRGYVDNSLKVPHIGWNGLHLCRSHPMNREIEEGECVYFVHSYFAVRCEDSLVAQAEYSRPITAMVAKENIWGCQFHPEKSGETGLKVMRAFCNAK